MNEQESRREALEDMIRISEEAGLYDNQPTLDEHLDAVDRARELIHRLEAQASTNLDGQTHVIPGYKTTVPLDYLNSLTRYQVEAQTLISQVRSLSEAAFRNGLGREENDPRFHYRLFATKILAILDGEQK